MANVLLPKVREQFGAHALDATCLTQWLWGVLTQLRRRGAVMHTELQAYAADAAEGRKAVLPSLGGELADLGRALETMREKLEGRAYAEAYVHALTHEMKSPLAAIRGAAELLEDAMPEGDRRRFTANIQASELRLRQLIDRMLELAALQNRQALKEPVRLDLAALAGRVIDGKRVLLDRAQVSVENRIPAGAMTRGEAFLLEQALSNLLDNALAFSPEGGFITNARVISPAVPLLDTWLQATELLRDPSHVRDNSLPEWLAMLGAAGFVSTQVATFRLRLEFGPWIERMAPPEAHVLAIRSLQRGAASDVINTIHRARCPFVMPSIEIAPLHQQPAMSSRA